MLQMKPDKLYMYVFEDMANRYLSKITAVIDEKLSEKAADGLAVSLWKELSYIMDSTGTGMCADIVALDSPLIALDPNLCTEEQKQKAAGLLRKELESGEKKLPDVIWRIAEERLALVSAALIEMFGKLSEHKKEICDLLFGGKTYTEFTDITTGAGDHHNGGRAAAIIETDTGKMVYKPRNSAADLRTYEFVKKYFPDTVVIPKCYTDMESFGVCEFLEKSIAEGDEAARKWFYGVGELTTLAKLLGSYDLHCENIIAANGLPAMIDIETVINPQIGEYSGKRIADTCKNKTFASAISSSVWRSLLLPHSSGEKELSVLVNTGPSDSSAPIVNGRPVTYFDYKDEYHKGFETAYRRCMERRAELERDIPGMFGNVPIRVMLRNTQLYGDLLIRTYKRKVLASEKARAELPEKLERALSFGYTERFGGIYEAEKTALLRGDIPYFYTLGSSLDLFSEGKCVNRETDRDSAFLALSGVDHALEELASMNETDLAFETRIIERAFDCFITTPGEKETQRPERSDVPLSREIAVSEAEALLGTIYSQMITAPDGTHGWIDAGHHDRSPRVLGPDFIDGTYGIGIFAAAVSAVTEDPGVKARADKCTEAACSDLSCYVAGLSEMIRNVAGSDTTPLVMLGESNGLAGCLKSAALINAYRGGLDETIDDIFGIMKACDVGKATTCDRMGGLAGLIAVICDIPGLAARNDAKDVVTILADRLLELKTFAADGYILWETVSKRHIISGAGHGMAGIAGALCSAGRLLGADRYLAAAKEALAFERGAYNEKFGTWNDYRTYPPQGYMHGYCSGAPGIGMALHRIGGAEFEDLAKLAADAVEKIPLMFRDHLCCGNSSVAEYYLTAGRHEEAGRVLGGMYERRVKLGVYRIMPDKYNEIVSPTMFFGIAGVGYEMLRYAFPDRIRSLLV